MIRLVLLTLLLAACTTQPDTLPSPMPLSTGAMTAFIPLESGESVIELDGATAVSPVYRLEGDQLVLSAQIADTELRIAYPETLPSGHYLLNDNSSFEVSLGPAYEVTGGDISLYATGFALLALFEIELRGSAGDSKITGVINRLRRDT